MRSLLFFLVAVLAGFGTSSKSFGQDRVARELGLTEASGSLPIWTKPSDEARRELGNFVRNAYQGVLLVGHPKHGRGTAWVVSKKHRLLATNAHVADIMHDAGGKMFAIVNGTSNLYQVDRTWYHPGVRRRIGGTAAMRSDKPADGPVDPNCPDVALLQLSGEGADLPVELAMAGSDAFSSLFAQSAAILGYPGHDTQSWPALGEAAEASFHDGVVSRLTNFQNSVTVPLAQRQFLQYTMSTWGGFSGSPILLPSGEVVAIHNSASYAQGAGGDVKAIPHGVRIDCLWELLVHHNLTDKVPIPVDKSAVDVARWLQDDPRDVALRQAIALTEEASRLVFRAQDYAAGARKCAEALQLAPEYSRPYRIRSVSYSNYVFQHGDRLTRETLLQQLQYAERDAKQYAKLNPTDPEALIGLAAVYNNAGARFDDDDLHREALKLAESLLQADVPTWIRAEGYSSRAIAYGNLGLDAQAERDHAEAIRLSPNAPILYENRAGFWRAQGRSDLQEQDLATARRLRGN